MNSFVLIMCILSGLGAGEWVEVPFIVPKSQGGVQTKSVFDGLVPKKLEESSCPDIHNLTMTTYSTMEKEAKSDPSTGTWASITIPSTLNFDNTEKTDENPEEKLNFLKSTEKTLISKIEEQIKRFGMTREARGKHIDFPSMESALITISLLLFAVYLIKLVMKILNSLQAKKGQMQMAPMSGLLVQGRKKRSFDTDLQHIELLQAIDKYNLLFK